MATKPKTTAAGRRALRLAEIESAVLDLQQGPHAATAQEIMTAVLALLERGAYHDGMSDEMLRHVEETEGPQAAAALRRAGDAAVLTPAQYRRKHGCVAEPPKVSEADVRSHEIKEYLRTTRKARAAKAGK
jgi:hypothetical protein